MNRDMNRAFEICCKCHKYSLDDKNWFEMDVDKIVELKKEGYKSVIGYCKDCGIKAYAESFETNHEAIDRFIMRWRK